MYFTIFYPLSHYAYTNYGNMLRWEAVGSPDIVELAYEKSMDILNEYTPESRSEAVDKELDRIYAEFEAEVAERKAK